MSVPYIADRSRLRLMMPKVYKLFLNITLQIIREQFHYDQSASSLAFEHEIDIILTEINAYIPIFVTRTDKPDRCERGIIFSTVLSAISRLFSAWKFYKDRRFTQNIYCTLQYILNEQREFKIEILNNKGKLQSIAKISSTNLKDLKQDFHKL